MFHRKWPRLAQYDYAAHGVYFLTLCTKDREKLLSRIVGSGLDPSLRAELSLTPYGMIAEHDLLEIPRHFPDAEILNYVIMPDHIHILLALGCGSSKEGSRPLPTNNREVSSYRQGNHFRQVCRGRIYASRAVYPLYRMIGTTAAGGIYAAPTDYPQNWE